MAQKKKTEPKVEGGKVDFSELASNELVGVTGGAIRVEKRGGKGK